MSQVYQVRLTSSISRTLRASDRMRHRVELSDILDEAQMKDILREVLREAGWEEKEDGKFETKGPNGETLVWDLDSNEVTATLEDERDVSADLDVTGRAGSQANARQAARNRLRQSEAQAEGQFSEAEVELGQQISEQLEQTEGERRKGLNKVLQKVYTEALKRKAEELGSVVEVNESENGDEYELTIQVEA